MYFQKKRCIAMLLAGGQGSRLKVLTENTAKPAVPFGEEKNGRAAAPVLFFCILLCQLLPAVQQAYRPVRSPEGKL